MVTCGICHDEHLTGIGELDSCDHSFCFACIQHWAEIESRCPFCKSRFTTISRKVLDLDKLPDSGAEFHDTVRQRFPGSVLETVAIPERNQVYLGDAEWDGEGEGQDPLGNVVCMECGRGDDEDNLMLCDGCERACHTYCANLDALPEGDWFCWVCQENRDRELAGEEVVDLTAARRPQRSTRTTLVASDFTLPRSRRRASSPGARSEISRPRRVRRRLVRSGEGLQPRRSGGSQRHGSDADSILNALERSISARDNAGMSTSTEHRRLAGLRGAWNSVRQGHRPFPVAAHPPPPHMPSTAPQADGPESEAWAAFEASRRAQDRAARRASATTAMPASNIQPVVPGSPPAHRHSGQQSASSLARQAVAEARSRGRRLGPTGRQLAASNPRTPLPVHRLSSSAQNSRVGASPRSSPVGPTVALERRRASADHDPPRSPRLRHASPMSGAGSRAMESEWQLHKSCGSGRAESAAGGRAVREPDRRSLEQRSSSSMYRSLPRGTSRIYRQTDAVQGPAYGLQLRGTDNATDSSNSAVAAADAESYLLNPNLMPVQRSFSDRPDDSAQPPEPWSTHLSLQQPSSQHQSWAQPASWQQQQQQSAQTAALLHALPTPCSPLHPPNQHQAYDRLGAANPSRQQTSWHDLSAPPVPLDEPAQVGQASFKDHAISQAAQHATGQVAQHAVGQVAQHAGPDKGEDSSDSSTSQLASRQQAVQGLQATDMSDATLGSRSRQHVGTKGLQDIHADAGQRGEAASSEAASEPNYKMTKQEAADAVKTLIKPLYVAKQLSKEQFKVIAQSCTHTLANNERTVQQDARGIVRDCMNDMGLSEQAELL